MDMNEALPLSARSQGVQVWGVQALLMAVSDSLAARFGAAAVQGEISVFTRAASGHCYFTLKDDHGAAATMRCAMFKRAASLLAFTPREGMKVTLRGRVAVYEARGELQFIVESMAVAGEGALYERFLRMKAALAAEGLFDDSRKRALPTHVARVGVVTSLAAAALHDVTTTLARRAPHVSVIVYPSLVQGVQAPASLVMALDTAVRRGEVDVLLLVRGGGSLEDLWAFNDERVVRAVAACPIPILVGVGHESDITLADLAADLRAPTPTAAAELAVPEREALDAQLNALRTRAVRAVSRRLEQQALHLDRAALLAGKPSRTLSTLRRALEALASRARPALQLAVQAHAHRLHRQGNRVVAGGRLQTGRAQHSLLRQQTRLDALDPRRTLSRGYAWVTDERGAPITSAHRLRIGSTIVAVLADGRARAAVEELELNTAAPRGDTSDNASRSASHDD